MMANQTTSEKYVQAFPEAWLFPGLVERLYVGTCMLLLGSGPMNIGYPLVKAIMVGGEPMDPIFYQIESQTTAHTHIIRPHITAYINLTTTFNSCRKRIKFCLFGQLAMLILLSEFDQKPCR